MIGWSFFASTSILIIGGLLAAMGATEKASGLVQEIPFAARTSALVFDLKLALLAAIFVHAFFRFTWSLRQYSFGAIMVGAAPEAKHFSNASQRETFADRAGRVMGLAAETFMVLVVLYRREFHSEVLLALREGLGPMQTPS